MEIDTHLGCAMSGLTADARTMIDHARVTSQNHAFTYNEPIKVESVTQAVCDLALRFGESVHDEDAMMSRPFGVALLIAGIDEKGPQLCVKPFFLLWQIGRNGGNDIYDLGYAGSTRTHQGHSSGTRQRLSDLDRKPHKANFKINGIR